MSLKNSLSPNSRNAFESKSGPAKRGILVKTAGIFFLIILTFIFIKFPQKINGAIVINSSQYEPVVSPRHGIFFPVAHNESEVRHGDVIGFLRSNQSVVQILRLNEMLSQNDLNQILNTEMEFDSLGEVSEAYNYFIRARSRYRHATNDYYLSSINELSNEQTGSLLQQKKFYDDLDKVLSSKQRISTKQLNIDSTLFTTGVLPETDYNNKIRESYFETENLINLRLQQIDSRIDKNMLERDQKIYERQVNFDLNDLKIEYEFCLRRLKGDLSDWLEKNVITNHKDGILYYTHTNQANRIIAANEIVGYVGSEQQRVTSYIGKIVLKPYNYGELRAGLRVIVKLDGYPYEKFGILEGRISTVSNIQIGDEIVSEVEIVADSTTLHPSMKLYQNMTGTAEVVIRRLSLMDKIIEKVKGFRIE